MHEAIAPAVELLHLFASRNVIVSLAIAGALVSFVGGYLLRDASSMPKNRARMVLRAGYALTWASVTAFIVAGFLVR